MSLPACKGLFSRCVNPARYSHLCAQHPNLTRDDLKKCRQAEECAKDPRINEDVGSVSVLCNVVNDLTRSVASPPSLPLNRLGRTMHLF